MSDVDNLHNEDKMMKVRPHCEILSKQFLLATQKPNHPNRVDISAPPPSRQMKRTLSSRFGDESRQMSRPDLPEEEYKLKLKQIHTNSVRDALNAMEPNKVLLSSPPPDTEKILPNATLSQLRTSNYLNIYKARINPAIHDLCPQCTMPTHLQLDIFLNVLPTGQI